MLDLLKSELKSMETTYKIQKAKVSLYQSISEFGDTMELPCGNYEFFSHLNYITMTKVERDLSRGSYLTENTIVAISNSCEDCIDSELCKRAKVTAFKRKIKSLNNKIKALCNQI